ncbi:MAG: hypothetical protein ACRD0K_05095 [Egibacteraceae bacterium]
MSVGVFFLRPARVPEGVVDLRHARVGGAGRLHRGPGRRRCGSTGSSTTRSGPPEVTVEQRLDWLARDPDGCSLRKYEQLAAVSRGAGQEQEAWTGRHRQAARPAPAGVLDPRRHSAVGRAYLAWFWGSIGAGWVLTNVVTGLLKTDSRLGS